MAKKKREPRWMDVVVHRVGFRKSPRVVQFVMTWGIAESDLGRELKNVEEYAEWWSTSVATAYRDLALFREAFAGQFPTPREFLEVGSADFSKAVPPALRSAFA